MIETRHLTYFVAAARCLNITRAAVSLRVAQPALTRAIHNLEAEMGVQLFRRVKNRIFLTESGSAFLAEAERALQQLENSVITAQRAARGEVGKLEIGFISTASQTVMPGLIQRFRRDYPGPMIVLHEMRAAEVEAGLRNGRIDVGLSYGPMREREFFARTLCPDRLLVALPSSHRLARAKDIELAQLLGDLFILPSQQTAGILVDAVLAECRHAGFLPAIGNQIATTTVTATLGLVSAGIGVTVTTENVRPYAPKGVVFRPIRNAKSGIGLSVMCRLHDTSPVVRNFLALLS